MNVLPVGCFPYQEWQVNVHGDLLKEWKPPGHRRAVWGSIHVRLSSLRPLYLARTCLPAKHGGFPLKHSDSQWSIVKHSEALKKTPLLKTWIFHMIGDRFSWKILPIFCFCMRQVYPSGRCGFVVFSACREWGWKGEFSQQPQAETLQPIGRCLWWLCKQTKARKSITLGPGGEVWEKLFKGIKGCIQDKNFEWSKEGDMLNLGKAP